VEFLDPIEAGVERAAFMARLEQVVEGKTDILQREAGFVADASG
jgi:1-acyl-sn-glycerol-3-phosphate acyltransferase